MKQLSKMSVVNQMQNNSHSVRPLVINTNQNRLLSKRQSCHQVTPMYDSIEQSQRYSINMSMERGQDLNLRRTSSSIRGGETAKIKVGGQRAGFNSSTILNDPRNISFNQKCLNENISAEQFRCSMNQGQMKLSKEQYFDNQF